jgi:hypothetical protein
MPHTSRFNYKAKASRVDDLQSKAENARNKLVDVSPQVGLQVNAINEIHEKVLDLASLSSHGTVFLDENRRIGDKEFDTVTTPADKVLADLPIRKIIIRSSQVISLLGQRLEVALHEMNVYERSLKDLISHAETTSAVTTSVQQSLAAIKFIGTRPRSAEIRDLEQALHDGEEFKRYGVSIDSDPEDESDDEYEANGTLDEEPAGNDNDGDNDSD